MGLSRGSLWRGGSSGYLFCLWVKIKWVCGGLVLEIMAHRWWVLADRRGVVIGSDGSINGFFFFFKTWFCFWFDGPVVVLGYMRVALHKFGCGW